MHLISFFHGIAIIGLTYVGPIFFLISMSILARNRDVQFIDWFISTFVCAILAWFCGAYFSFDGVMIRTLVLWMAHEHAVITNFINYLF